MCTIFFGLALTHACLAGGDLFGALKANTLLLELEPSDKNLARYAGHMGIMTISLTNGVPNATNRDIEMTGRMEIRKFDAMVAPRGKQPLFYELVFVFRPGEWSNDSFEKQIHVPFSLDDSDPKAMLKISENAELHFIYRDYKNPAVDVITGHSIKMNCRVLKSTLGFMNKL